MVTRAPVILGPEFAGLPDDTEETLVGSSLHQGAIVALYSSLTLCGPERGLPWFVGNQLTMVIPRVGDNPRYMPAPDILVHPTLTMAPRSSLVPSRDGPPALIVEVASPGTAEERDVNLTSPRGKPGVYEAIGVREYLVFDPTEESLGRPVWARRAGPRGFEPWPADANGRWVSAALGIAFEPRGILLRVYDQAGGLVPLVGEVARELARREQEIAALREELRRLRSE